ncbi:unnamed protein product [Gongylonema pulchrum]|uniref:Uncharacterized protein n=1 Tax=Gongylonema pulchrum TaxID=637853 RepID=A0A183EQV5_9BILA|nr:unnamed protein product [Gongylonema pulchrum]
MYFVPFAHYRRNRDERSGTEDSGRVVGKHKGRAAPLVLVPEPIAQTGGSGRSGNSVSPASAMVDVSRIQMPSSGSAGGVQSRFLPPSSSEGENSQTEQPSVQAKAPS